MSGKINNRMEKIIERAKNDPYPDRFKPLFDFCNNLLQKYGKEETIQRITEHILSYFYVKITEELKKNNQLDDKLLEVVGDSESNIFENLTVRERDDMLRIANRVCFLITHLEHRNGKNIKYATYEVIYGFEDFLEDRIGLDISRG